MGISQFETTPDLGFPKIGPPLKLKRSEAPEHTYKDETEKRHNRYKTDLAQGGICPGWTRHKTVPVQDQSDLVLTAQLVKILQKLNIFYRKRIHEEALV